MKCTFLFLFLICIMACKPNTEVNASENNTNLVANPDASSFKFGSLPPLPTNLMQELHEKATYVDYIFYKLPFSISQDDAPSIASNLSLISPNGLNGLLLDCKPIGREFFHFEGLIKYEAELYFSDGCQAYVFLENEKPIYVNQISETGMKFYNNLMAQANQIQSKGFNAQ